MESDITVRAYSSTFYQRESSKLHFLAAISEHFVEGNQQQVIAGH